MIKRVLTILSIVISLNTISAQEYEVRTYLGANYYQGDLAPTTSKLSFSQGQMSWAVMTGMKLNDVFKFNMKYMTGKLVGRDSDSNDLGRKRRNLNFASPLHEFGINTEVNINHFWKGLNKYGLNMYYTTGVNVFRFNPKTFKRNTFGVLELVDLQPLGTEGQGLPGYDDKYKLTQLNIPFGFGFKFHLFDNIEMGIELCSRVTFTDHIDDVSGNYVSYDELIDADRPMAAMLANRTGEFLGTGPTNVASGTKRGDPDDNDWYFFSGVYLSYNWGAGYKPLKMITEETEKELIESDQEGAQ